MTKLNLSADQLLSTTRAVRKRLDLTRPVPMNVLRECLSLALQAPSASNAQDWHFLIVTDADRKSRIATHYRAAFAAYLEAGAAEEQALAAVASQPARRRLVSSARYLADNLERVPVLFIPCIKGRLDTLSGPQAVAHLSAKFASIIPAVWSFMLAARERGLGTCWTTLHLAYEKQVAELLEIPFEEFTQVALVPVAYTLGTDFKAAARRPLETVMHLNRWGVETGANAS